MAMIGQFCLSFWVILQHTRITIYKHFWNAVVALLDKPDLGTATKRGRTLSALLDNASVKVMQDDSSLLSELHMGLSLIR